MTWQSGPVTGLTQVKSQSIGSGNSVTLITATQNVIGVQLSSLTISSGATSAGGGLGSSFLVEDTVTDSDGTQYGAVEIGMGQGTQGEAENSAPFDLGGIIVPAGASLTLNNGGAGGTGGLRRCSATVVFVILTSD